MPRRRERSRERSCATRVRSWRGEKHSTRQSAGLALRDQQSVLNNLFRGRLRRERREVVVERENALIGRVTFAIRPLVSRTQIAGRIVSRSIADRGPFRPGLAMDGWSDAARQAPTRRERIESPMRSAVQQGHEPLLIADRARAGTRHAGEDGRRYASRCAISVSHRLREGFRAVLVFSAR